ncbi:DUF2252 domain-containing protein [Streptomyces spectabilis]|uniref:DUF2252 domain-containing protein n=1 Tax=Streptomyces spectabilis TaxID=68270 RepID=A0A5P2XAQ8_STRST|nr:DUF2252 domain-containing protein [Streptomyces spectabilis]MBB5102935.1 uncharacterized protein (DUF2252 family) [Streptomyces spectabilis]MCI3902135.1 DUF2252 domain-containing protein [Streptomyces spectabilis]QEV59522.1 DUF2252 domain-containing protein [Streptomyces spectabilis]GGV15799.1 hypothetical protein GCM10010245_27300 [Streptomyces spectabilis]
MTTAAERAERGKAARKRASRSSHGAWIPSADRADPVAVLERQSADRVQDLLPIRYGRMAASPFAFLRGAAAVMAGDLAAQRHTGLTVQLCGDAHLLNFGVFASPERRLLFDLNDFDETYPGPFEWDVKRLAASVAVAARETGRGEDRAHDAALAAVTAYRTGIRRLARKGELDVWYASVDTDDLLRLIDSARRRERAAARLAHARRHTSLQALGKLTEVVDDRRRIIHDPPLLEPAGAPDMAALRKIFGDYRSTLAEERRLLLDRYRFVDAARKVVGVGSVGTRCFVVLLTGRDTDDPLFLQIKEAVRSVLEEHLPTGPYLHPGHRVVAGQRLLQAAGDIFLGWMTGPQGRAYYWRQLRDMKGSVDIAELEPAELLAYARLCGTALARAHARSGDRIAIAAYLGSADTFDRAVAAFAVRYVSQNATDHKALTGAIDAGVLTAATTY